MYRPLSDVNVFFENIILVLDKLITENVKFVIAGDFNINISTESNESKMFLFLLGTYNLQVGTKEPTRITSESATCLGNIVSTIDGKTTVSEEHISDHCAVEFGFQAQPYKKKPQNYEQIRMYNERSHQQFENMLLETD
ncbi:hypothetical protein WA026_012628 [Henosepilachna vigintioctopunctata]|uniref:Endonuclease/exonuclease/phosphatase domain-containing protein n=1 Tax=Henosepilachna vigintioctopunctata TaxID=420089 RepID=A0AAW1U5M0_9CUCU